MKTTKSKTTFPVPVSKYKRAARAAEFCVRSYISPSTLCHPLSISSSFTVCVTMFRGYPLGQSYQLRLRFVVVLCTRW